VSDTLTLAAALLLGLVASGHCVLMCGGIAAALGLAAATRPDGRPRGSILVAYQLGRIVSYTIAGLLLGGALGGLVGLLDIELVRSALRTLAAVVLACAALVAFGAIRASGNRLGTRLWSKLAPLGRRLLPIANTRRAFAFGMVWGWMPCGFVYTVLLLATLQLEPLRAAATMAAFGVGTAPAMLAAAFGAGRIVTAARQRSGRRVAGVVLGVAAALTLAGPLWPNQPAWLHACLPFGCSTR